MAARLDSSGKPLDFKGSVDKKGANTVDPEKEREANYLRTVPPAGSGLGGTSWRFSPEGKKHRADWEAKNPRGLTSIQMPK
jgi:hypothetical protein